jgi:hypothetical protein
MLSAVEIVSLSNLRTMKLELNHKLNLVKIHVHTAMTVMIAVYSMFRGVF